MKRFTVPCLFFGEQTSKFDLYVGNPHKDYDAIRFQKHWLRQRKGVVDRAFLNWLRRVRDIAFENSVDFQTLCSQATKTGEFVSVERPKRKIKANLLLPLWSSSQKAKEPVITRVTRLICGFRGMAISIPN